MRMVLLHYHILKNGGSTIEEILRRSLFERFASFDHPDRDAEIKPPELIEYLKRHPELQAFSSHQIYYPVPKEPGFLFFDICFLRDPFDRIRSIYDYFRGKPAGDDPIRVLANQNPLRDFVRRLIDEMPWTVNDVQVNLLANGLVNDQPRGPEDLEVATRRMRESSVPGVVDRFEESLVAGEYVMRTVFPTIDCARERVNESARPGSTLEDRVERFRADLGEEVFAELWRLNQMDCELLRRARAEVRRRFDATPHAEERLREMQNGVLRSAHPRTVRRDRPVSPKVGVLPRWKRGLLFLLDFRMSRPGSDFRRLFDAEFYGDTLWHYVMRGAFEGRNPHPLFDSKFFLRGSTPRANPLSEYLRHGGRPHPLFDPEYYGRCYPDVRKARINPLLHYVLYGAAEGRKPNPWFVPEFYSGGCAEARKVANPLVHFAETESANPHPLFDCESYRRAHPEVEGNALAAFLSRGETRVCEDARIEIDEVWLDERAVHSKRFFESVRSDQLAAQLNSTVEPLPMVAARDPATERRP